MKVFISFSILAAFVLVHSLDAQPSNALDLVKISEVMGATEAEATQKLSGSVSRTLGSEFSGYFDVYVPFTGSIQVGEYDMIAIFQFGDRSGCLDQVLIQPVGSLPTWRRERINTDLKEIVSKIFGEPSYDDSLATPKDRKKRKTASSGASRQAPWILASGTEIFAGGAIVLRSAARAAELRRERSR